MPNFDVISDMHLDFYPNANTLLRNMPVSSEVLLIAGDMCELRNFQDMWLEILLAKYRYIFYVPGNHDWYGSSTTLDVSRRFMGRVGWSSFKVLQRQTDTIFGNFKISGATLWFPDHPTNTFHERFLGDFHYIRDFKPWVYQQHEMDKEFFHKKGRGIIRGVGFQGAADIWMMHHLPFSASIHPKYANSPTNRFFLGNLGDAFYDATYKPRVIVHGHTHEAMDYMIDDTRVVCNPVGYPNEGGEARFKPKLVEF